MLEMFATEKLIRLIKRVWNNQTINFIQGVIYKISNARFQIYITVQFVLKSIS